MISVACLWKSYEKEGEGIDIHLYRATNTYEDEEWLNIHRGVNTVITFITDSPTGNRLSEMYYVNPLLTNKEIAERCYDYVQEWLQ